MATKVRTTVSLEPELYNYGNSVSKKFFQDNFSMFLGYLISLYKEGLLVGYSCAQSTNNSNKEQQSAKPIQASSSIDTDTFDSILQGVENYFDN